VGEAFSSAGLALSAAYSDGSSTPVTSGWTLTWNGAALAESNTAITATAGTKTITVTWQDQTISFRITVNSPAVYTIRGIITKSDGGPAAGATV
jgi:hypothetical protein